MLEAIPEDSGMAYVLVQHLDPKHDSLLPALLQKGVKIPVHEITDDIKVEPTTDFISKPFEIIDLYSKVASLFNTCLKTV